MKKCNLIWFYLPLLAVLGWGCSDKADEPVAEPELYLLPSDSLALVRISESFKTESAVYPHPWSVADRSSWEGSIRLDTLVDEETGTAVLTVGALTLYIPEPSNPMNTALTQLRHVRDFKLYACPGAIVQPGCTPIGCDSILIDKIDPQASGYIKVYDQVWDISTYMQAVGWGFDKVVIRGTDINFINFIVDYNAVIDLSNNLLDGNVDYIMGRFTNRVNLSHNKYTGLGAGWDNWVYFECNVPNLQYNDIPIPEWVLDTDFWQKNHECFIGNPGYKAPEN